jgi:hypothetical protein
LIVSTDERMREYQPSIVWIAVMKE